MIELEIHCRQCGNLFRLAALSMEDFEIRLSSSSCPCGHAITRPRGEIGYARDCWEIVKPPSPRPGGQRLTRTRCPV